MKERPILFNGEMVRAILDGRKTQTRRMVKFPINADPRYVTLTRMQDGFADGVRPVFGAPDEPNWFSVKSPFGTIGDRLWVRETWMDCDIPDGMVGADQVVRGPKSTRVENWVRAAWHKDSPDPGGWPIRRGWTHSIHMPRWASRITLEITAVRVERVQDITEEDAKAEGVESGIWEREAQMLAGAADADDEELVSFRDGFGFLWQSRHGNWDANPWVWVYSIKLIKL